MTKQIGMSKTDAAVSSLKLQLETRAAAMKTNLRNQGWKYAGFEELVMDSGQVMNCHQFPSTIKRGSHKLCYSNCQKLAFTDENLIYVEGYAIAHDIQTAVSHAWLLTPKGYAIDPTWGTPGQAYWGVPFATNWIESFIKARQKISKVDNLSIIEGNHLEGYSLLKEGLPSGACATLQQSS